MKTGKYHSCKMDMKDLKVFLGISQIINSAMSINPTTSTYRTYINPNM